jgi:hypothetical protein
MHLGMKDVTVGPIKKKKTVNAAPAIPDALPYPPLCEHTADCL